MHKDVSTERSVSFHALFVQAQPVAAPLLRRICSCPFHQHRKSQSKPPLSRGVQIHSLAGISFVSSNNTRRVTAVPLTVTTLIVRGGPDCPDSCSLTCFVARFSNCMHVDHPLVQRMERRDHGMLTGQTNRECFSVIARIKFRASRRSFARSAFSTTLVQEITEVSGDANLNGLAKPIGNSFHRRSQTPFSRGDVGVFG